MSNWHSIELGEVLTITSGGTPNRKVNEYYQDGTIGWVKTGELKVKYIYNSVEKITELGLTNSSAKLFPPNTVLIAMYGASIGSTSILKKEFTTNQACGALLPSNQVYPEYLYYYLKKIKPELISRGVGGAQPNISGTILKQTKIPLPPLSIQKKIAEVLDKADELRQIKKKTIEKLDQLIQSIFLDMFGDPVTNPKGWDVKKLGDVCSKITDGVHFKPNYIEHGIPFISVKDITTGTLYFDNCKFISKEDHEKYIKRCKPEKDDILYTKVGATYGRPAIIDTDIDFSIYVSVSLIKPMHDLINSRYLNITMANPAIKRQADKVIKGIGVPDLHLNMIREFLIPLPPMNIQEQFVEKIEIINSLKSQHKQVLFKLENLFNSLMQRAFKGELQFKD